MSVYTVILRRPKRITDCWPDDVYVATVFDTTNFADAINKAKKEVRLADGNKAKSSEYSLVFAFQGNPTVSMHWFQCGSP